MKVSDHYKGVRDAALRLRQDEQELLLEELRGHLKKRCREALRGDVAEAREEFSQGHCACCTPEDLMRDILS